VLALAKQLEGDPRSARRLCQPELTLELVHDVNRSSRERLKGLLRIEMNIDHLSKQVEVISSRCAQMMLGQLFECITSGLNPLNAIIIGLVNRFDQQAQGLVAISLPLEPLLRGSGRSKRNARRIDELPYILDQSRRLQVLGPCLEVVIT